MMSGTSLDSIDACLLKIYDDLSFEIIDNYSLDYPKEIRTKLLNFIIIDPLFIYFIFNSFSIRKNTTHYKFNKFFIYFFVEKVLREKR